MSDDEYERGRRQGRHEAMRTCEMHAHHIYDTNGPPGAYQVAKACAKEIRALGVTATTIDGPLRIAAGVLHQRALDVLEPLTREGRLLDDAHHALLNAVEVVREALKTQVPPTIDAAIRAERNRCVRMVSEAADAARASNRKKAAAELDMLARDMGDAREPHLAVEPGTRGPRGNLPPDRF